MKQFSEKDKKTVEIASHKAVDEFIGLTEAQSFWEIYDEVSNLDCIRTPDKPGDMIQTLLLLYTEAVLRIHKLKAPLQ